MIRIIGSNFIKSAVNQDQYPAARYAEFAFAGRSNVGKSSLINTVLNRKKLAKVSRSPGKTRLLNFFEVSFKQEEDMGYFSLVDLPGYGYAKVSESQKDSWRTMVGNYLQSRLELRGVFVLVDMRHSADPKDLAMINMLRTMEHKYAVIATKCDKIPRTKRKKVLHKLRIGLELEDEELIAFSALKDTGRDNIIRWIEKQILY